MRQMGANRWDGSVEDADVGDIHGLFLQPPMIHVDISITWQHLIAGKTWVFEDKDGKKDTQASGEVDKAGDSGNKD